MTVIEKSSNMVRLVLDRTLIEPSVSWVRSNISAAGLDGFSFARRSAMLDLPHCAKRRTRRGTDQINLSRVQLNSWSVPMRSFSPPAQCCMRPSSSGRVRAGCHSGTGRAQTVSPQSFCHSSSRQWTQALQRITQLLFKLYQRHACVYRHTSAESWMAVNWRGVTDASLKKNLKNIFLSNLSFAPSETVHEFCIHLYVQLFTALG